MMSRILLPISLFLAVISLAHAQTVNLDVRDAPTGAKMAFDSVVAIRSLDNSRWVTTGSKITLPVTSVEQRQHTGTTVSIQNGALRVFSDNVINRIQISSLNGDAVAVLSPAAQESVIPIGDQARGLYAVQIDVGRSTLRQLVYIDAADRSYNCSTRSKYNGTVFGSEEFSFTVYASGFVSKAQRRLIDVSTTDAITLDVERPQWTNRVVHIQVIGYYNDTNPVVVYDQALYPGKDASGLTKAWSFSPDEDTYEITNGHLINGRIVYTIGDETSAVLEVVFLHDFGTTTAYYLTATDRPTVEGNKLTFQCSPTMPITYYYRDQFNNVEEEDTHCGGRSLVFTLE